MISGAQDATVPMAVTGGQIQIDDLKSATGMHYNAISSGAYDLPSGLAELLKEVGGRQEARTPDLRVANAALSQLS